MSTIFLSYARGDDEPFVRQLYDDLTKAKFEVWFDRVNMPSRGLTFHQEIRDAITHRDRLLLVVGPKAVASEYVRQEWQFAWFEAEKVVTPILRLGDYPLAIDELKLVHAEDFRNDADYALHLKELIRILNEPPPRMGKLIAVPSLPAHYLSRTDRLIPLRDAVRSGLDSAAPFGGMAARQQFHGIAGAAKHVGMHGMGGIGKSVLANLLAHDRKIREAFPDGIVWVGLGSVPVVADLMRRVHVDFGGDGAFVTEHEGKAKLKELLSDKAVLLVLDDAWRRQDIEAFDILGPRCRALITTRDAGLLTSVGGTQHLVELLTDDEALRLLALAVGKEVDELPAEARLVIKQSGRLPLAVSLAGGMVAAGMSWTNLLTAFDRHKLEFFKDEHRPEQHQSLWKMIEMSVRALDAAEQVRLVELGVFPEDEAVPEKAVATLWRHTGRLDDLDTAALLVKLKQRSLVQLSAGEQGGGDVGRASLHDLVHDYCVRRAEKEFGKPAHLHDLLLDAYRQQATGGWWTGPNDGYFHRFLGQHLEAAGSAREHFDLLLTFEWLAAVNSTCGCSTLLAHLSQWRHVCEGNLMYRLLDMAFPFLTTSVDSLARQICQRLRPGTSAVLDVLVREAERSAGLLTLHSELLPPEGPLLRRTDAPEPVTALACNRCGSVAYLGREDGKIDIFSVLTELVIDTFGLDSSGSKFAHDQDEAKVRQIAVTPCDTLIIVLVGGQLTVWNLNLKRMVWSTDPGSPAIVHFDLSGDSSRLVSIDSKGGASVWSTVTGDLIAHFKTIGGRCAFCIDNNHVVVASRDVLNVYSLRTGERVQSMKGEGFDISLLAAQKGGSLAVTADENIAFWDLSRGERTGELLLEGFRHQTVLVLASDDMRVFGATDYGLIGVFDIDGSRLHWEWQESGITLDGFAISGDGTVGVSSCGQELLFWDLAYSPGQRWEPLKAHGDCVLHVFEESASGSIVTVSKGFVNYWDLVLDDSGQPSISRSEFRFDRFKFMPSTETFYVMSLSESGRYVACNSIDGSFFIGWWNHLSVLDVQERKLHHLLHGKRENELPLQEIVLDESIHACYAAVRNTWLKWDILSGEFHEGAESPGDTAQSRTWRGLGQPDGVIVDWKRLVLRASGAAPEMVLSFESPISGTVLVQRHGYEVIVVGDRSGGVHVFARRSPS